MARGPHPLHLVSGLTAWSAWFVAAYGGLSLACRLRPPGADEGAATWINAALLALTLLTVAALLLGALACWRARRPTPGEPSDAGTTPRRRFVAPVAAGLYLAAAVSTLVVGLPIVVLPPCT
jgi:hypothetical protein